MNLSQVTIRALGALAALVLSAGCDQRDAYREGSRSNAPEAAPRAAGTSSVRPLDYSGPSQADKNPSWGGNDEVRRNVVNDKEAVNELKTDLKPTQGSKVKGKVDLKREGNAVRVIVDVEGLSPGKHGVHIHEKADCSAPDASSAGEHFAPEGHQHGSPEVGHAGDLGNLVADAKGKAHLDMLDTRLSFDGPNSLIGRSLIVHEKEDDLSSQPSGNSGKRLACAPLNAPSAPK